MGSKARKFDSLSFWVLLSFAVVGLVLWILLSIQTRIISARTEDFQKSFVRSSLIFKESLQKNLYGLEALAGVYAIQNFKPSLEQIQAYAKSQNNYLNYDGSLGFGFIRRVPSENLFSFVAEAQKSNSEFNIRSLSQDAQKLHQDYYIIDSIEPIAVNHLALGVDISTEARRFEAAQKAMKSGKPAISSKIQLVQLDQQEPGFLLLLPVYQNMQLPATEVLRAEKIMGWVYTPIVARKLIEEIASQADSHLILEIYDLDDKSAKIFETRESSEEQVHLASLELDVYGRKWLLKGKVDGAIWSWHETLILWFSFLFVSISLVHYIFRFRKFVLSSRIFQEKNKSLEEWQSAILNSANYGIMSFTADGVIETFNQAASQMTGFLASEVIGHKPSAVFHDPIEMRPSASRISDESGSAISFSDKLSEIVLRNGGHTSRWIFTRKDGTPFPGQLSISPVLNGGKEHIGYIGIVQDISELLSAESELRQVDNALNSSAIVATTDLAGRIIEVNDNFCLISGYSREELIGKDHRILNSGFHSKVFFKELWKTIRSGRHWSGEIQNKKKNGELYWVQTVISPLFNEKGEIDRFIAIRFDITEKKISEMRLMQSSKMASLGEMAGAIAHEINNPLAIIHAQTQLLQAKHARGLLNEDKLLEGLQKILQTSVRISKIVTGLRAFSRDSSQEALIEIDPAEIFKDTSGLCGESLKYRHIDFRILHSVDCMIACRPVQLSQALLNLINNAKDAIADLPVKWIEVRTELVDGYLCIRVTDSGSGIPPEVAEKIMQPFYTTKEVGKGTGLGLSISKGLLEGQSGRLYYNPQAPHTQFVIEIPLSQAGHQQRSA